MVNVGRGMIPDLLFATFSSEKPDWMSDLSVFCDCRPEKTQQNISIRARADGAGGEHKNWETEWSMIDWVGGEKLNKSYGFSIINL